MAKQKSEFVSATGTTFEIVKGLAEEVWELGGNDDRLRRIISDRSLRQSLAKLIVGESANGFGTYRVTVDYDQPLSAMIDAGHYGWLHEGITAEHFPVQGEGQVEVEIGLVHFGGEMNADKVLEALGTLGLRPAKIEELLALGADQPELQRQFPIIALGSLWCDPGGDRSVASLGWNGAVRGLGLRWCEDVWDGFCRFAAVRKSA